MVHVFEPQPDDYLAIVFDCVSFCHAAVDQNQWYQFGIGEFTTHFRTYFSGNWDVHWGLTDLDFDPWPCVGVGSQVLYPRSVNKETDGIPCEEQRPF